MYWYKISEGDYPDEYIEITLGHKNKYTKDKFFALIEGVKAELQTNRIRSLYKLLVKKHGFIVLPIVHQYHVSFKASPKGEEVNETPFGAMPT